MSTLRVATIETENETTDLTLKTGNTSGPSILLSAGNNDIEFDGNLALTDSGNLRLGDVADILSSTTGAGSIAISAGTTYNSGGTIVYRGSSNAINPYGLEFNTGGSERMRIDANGHLLPATNNTYDLGSSTLRWRNIYTNDLNLSNGIGDYTIVEGEEDLFLYNNKNGKTYKFLIQEVDPSEAPKKAL